MSKHYDNIEYDDKESNIQNTWKKTYSTEESKQEDYDRNNHSISLSEIKEQETLEEIVEKLFGNDKVCSGCLTKHPTVNRNMFDGLCADCTDKALYDYEFAKKAEKINEQFKKK